MEKQIRDISQHFSKDTLNFIEKLFHFTHQRHLAQVTPSIILWNLIQKKNISEYFNQLKVDVNSLATNLSNLFASASDTELKPKKGIVIFSLESRSILFQAYFEMLKYAREEVTLEDLSVACLKMSSLAKIKSQFNINITKLEQLIVKKIGGSYIESTSPSTPTLSKYSIDLTEKAKKEQLPQIVDRDREINQLIRILIRQMKNNAALIGEPGVGKKSIIHGLATKIAHQEVPDQLKNIKLLSLNLSNIQSAAPGRMEALIEEILNEIKLTGNILLFIDDFHNIMGSETSDFQSISNILKPALARGEIHIIGATTLSHYRKYIERDSTFSQQLEIVKIDEPSPEITLEILKSTSKRFEDFHKVKISEEAMNAAISLSKRYIQDRFLPDKAIGLLDESASKVSLEQHNTVTADDIKQVIAERTGIPVSKITASDVRKLTNLDQDLKAKVIGQDHAVHVVSEVIRRSRAGLKDPKKPIGTFLFLGPSGVGKTHLAKTLTRLIYDTEKAMIRIDMSEFSESHTVQRLIGSPPGYVGYEEGGQLTNPVWERPYSLILLDEIEKAHPKVFDIFLQVLDEGRLTDGQGRTVDFKNTVIIATSNIAADEILKKSQEQSKILKTGEGFDREKFYTEEIMPIMREHFRPEFINRFDEVVVFNPLGVDELIMIAKLQIKDIQERLSDKSIIIEVSDQTLQQYAQKSYNPAYGARPLIRLLQDNIENVVAKKIISGELQEGQTINF